MSTQITDADWKEFSNVINEFHNSAFQDEVLFYKALPSIKRAGEDNPTKKFSLITLKGLFYYNFFRTWPITGYEINGEFDKQSETVLLNVEYMKENNLVDDSLRLIYTPYQDIFVHRGQQYEASGDTFISQTKDTPLLFMLILKRRENLEQLQT